VEILFVLILRTIARRWREGRKSNVDTSASEAGVMIAQSIESGSPFLAGRGGWMESYGAGMFCSGEEPDRNLLEKLHHHAGIFPATASQLEEFSRAYLDALSSADLLGVLQSPFEGWLLAKVGCGARRCLLRSLEPYFSARPWSARLAGRRVLVVHPFVDSIVSQYRERRALLFGDPQVLPVFDLVTVKAPQTMCGQTVGFSDWGGALSDLQQRVAREQFDVALVGCGAYGLPLAAYIKMRLRKPAIHLGGATQLLFGVSGARWRERPEFASVINEFWRPPLESERPAGWETIEKGCYW